MKYLAPLFAALVMAWLLYEYKRPIIITVKIDGVYDGDGGDYLDYDGREPVKVEA
jgi:hypothetical protein